MVNPVYIHNDACLQMCKNLKISTNQASWALWVCVGSSLFLFFKASEAPLRTVASPGLVLVVVAHRSTTDPNVLVALVGNAASHIATETSHALLAGEKHKNTAYIYLIHAYRLTHLSNHLYHLQWLLLQLPLSLCSVMHPWVYVFCHVCTPYIV